jgi:hypothetical protein
MDNIKATNTDNYLLVVDNTREILNAKIWGSSKQDRPLSLAASTAGNLIL